MLIRVLIAILSVLVTLIGVLIRVLIAILSVLIAVLSVLVTVVVATLAELDGLDGGDRLVGGDAVVGRRLDDVEHPLLEVGAVHHEGIRLAHLVGLLRRGLEVVGIGAHGHHGHDVDHVAGEGLDDVAEDVGGDDHGRGATGGAGSVRCSVAVAATGHQEAGGPQQQGYESEAGHGDLLW